MTSDDDFIIAQAMLLGCDFFPASFTDSYWIDSNSGPFHPVEAKLTNEGEDGPWDKLTLARAYLEWVHKEE